MQIPSKCVHVYWCVNFNILYLSSISDSLSIYWLGLDLAAGRKEQCGIPLLLSCPLPVRPCMSVAPRHPPCVSPSQSSVFLPLMLGTDRPPHCQTNDCLDHTACQPGCLLHHWDMDSVSVSMCCQTTIYKLYTVY